MKTLFVGIRRLRVAEGSVVKSNIVEPLEDCPCIVVPCRSLIYSDSSTLVAILIDNLRTAMLVIGPPDYVKIADPQLVGGVGSPESCVIW